MSKRAEYHLEGRFIVEPTLIETIREHCSPSERFTWVSKTERLRVHTFKGVPGKHLDILLPDSEPAPFIACEIGLKKGSFDGNKRWRLTFRSWHCQWEEVSQYPPSAGSPGTGRLIIEENTPEHVVFIALWYGGGMWAQQFPRLRYLVDERTDMLGIFLRQWKDWFNFLPEEDVRQAGAYWLSLEHTQREQDICVLNRTASSALYDLATSMGWRKLTLRDKARLGLAPDSQQWQRVERIDALRASPFGNKSGVGEFTQRAAAGDSHYIQTAYGMIEED